MKRWFAASLEGSYVGAPAPGPSAELDASARSHRPQIYRAALRQLTWLEVPDEQEPELALLDPVLRQTCIEHAHVSGVRGGGTYYEGPIFDLRLGSVQLTYPTEHAGRAYGRIVGSAVAWLDLPDPPPVPEVRVNEQLTSRASQVPAPAALEASVYTPAAPSGETTPAGTAPAPEAPLDANAQPVAVPPATPAKPRIPRLLPLSSVALAVGLGLLVGCGWSTAGLWALFMLPTLIARAMFGTILRDSTFLRGFGYGLIVVQASCVVALLSPAPTGCALPSLLPMLGVIAVLFPAGLLPSAVPLSCVSAGLALTLASFCHASSATCAERSSHVQVEHSLHVGRASQRL